MDYWFLDNLDKLVPIIIAVLYFMGASRAKSKGDEQEGSSPDVSERARKIQEDIRRKILERQGGGRAPSPEVTRTNPNRSSSRIRRPFRLFHPRNPSSSGRLNLSLSRNLLFNAPDPYEEERRKIEEKLRQARELAKKAEIAGKKASVKNRFKDQNGGSLRAPRILYWMDLMTRLQFAERSF